jgi:Zn-dependent peptidase ImmA (M78 family)
MPEHFKPKCEYRKIEEIREIVEEFRREYWKSGSVPIDMERIVENGLGLSIIPISGIRNLNKIDAYLSSDLSGIVVDIHQYMDPQNRWENRLRFSFAHEVGHFVLHRHIYAAFNIESPEEYSDFVMNFPEDEYRSFEWQANEFAGSLLVPRQRLMQEVLTAKEKLGQKKLQHLWDENREQVLISMSPLLGRIFGVSVEVMERRLEKEKDLWG